MIVAYIDSHRERFGVEPICTVLSGHGITIAPSTYYAHKATPVSPAALEEAYLANAIATLWRENWGVYGARKLHAAARRAGIDVGRDQVARLMGIVGVSGAVRGRHRTRTTTPKEGASRSRDRTSSLWLSQLIAQRGACRKGRVLHHNHCSHFSGSSGLPHAWPRTCRTFGKQV